jgi:hypothetical protein
VCQSDSGRRRATTLEIARESSIPRNLPIGIQQSMAAVCGGT